MPTPLARSGHCPTLRQRTAGGQDAPEGPVRRPVCSQPASSTPCTGRSTDDSRHVSADGAAEAYAADAEATVRGSSDGSESWGPYRIGRLLGRGGMGEVYEAEHTESGRRLALKVLRSRLQNADDRARFLREGQLAASVSHPHTVYIFGSEEIAGMPVISMELLPGGTLKDRVAARGAAAAGRSGRGRPRHHRRPRRRAGGGHPAPRHQAVELLRRQRRVREGRRLRPVDLDARARRAARARPSERLPGHAAVRAARTAARRAARRARRHLCGRRHAVLPAHRPAAVRRARSAASSSRASPPSRRSRRGSLAPDDPARLAAIVLQCLAKTPAERPGVVCGAR